MTRIFFTFFMMMTLHFNASGQEPTTNIHYIRNQDATLFTTEYPNPGKETVILLHGGPGFPSDLTEVARILHPHFRVITFHQRGTRQSPAPGGDYSMEAYLSDIKSIALYFNCPQFHLFGHSWGGLYAQIYASKYPEDLKSLFLCCPGSGTGPEWTQTEQEVMQLNRAKCTRTEWMLMGWNNLLGMLGSDRAYRRLFRQVMHNYNDEFVKIDQKTVDFANLKAAPINKTRKFITRYPVLPTLTNPAFPISIVYGDQDIYQSSKNFVVRRYPGARVFTIPNCGHIPWLHNPEAYERILAKHYL